ncbi:hypothetical protein MASR2M39_16830 [Ignavibacteriales bacterium]
MHKHDIGQAARKFAKVCEILEKYDYKSDKLVPILQAVQDEYRYLPEDVLAFIATTLDISPQGFMELPLSTHILLLNQKGNML